MTDERTRIAARGALLAALLVGGLVGGAAPASAERLDKVTSIVAFAGHACARLANGTARCWGLNSDGQLGNGSTVDASTATVVHNPAGTGPLRKIVQLTAGNGHTCALLKQGQVRCWGDNSRGQLGDGTMQDRVRPVAVKNGSGTGPLKGVRDIGAGGSHTCAVLKSGKARCWGSNGDGRLGNGTNDQSSLPVLVKESTGTGPIRPVVPIGGLATVDGGINHTCALTVAGQVRCWGADENGELGNGQPLSGRSLAAAVRNPAGPGNLKKVAAVDVGEYHTCARLASGQVRCWGYGPDGQLGNGTADNRSRPVQVKSVTGSGGLTGVTAIGSAGYHTCARLSNGRARCWGDDDDAQLGDGTASDLSSRPVVVRGAGGRPLSRIKRITGGYQFTCALLKDGVVKCWGRNNLGQLGNDTFLPSTTPVTVQK